MRRFRPFAPSPGNGEVRLYSDRHRQAGRDAALSGWREASQKKPGVIFTFKNEGGFPLLWLIIKPEVAPSLSTVKISLDGWHRLRHPCDQTKLKAMPFRKEYG